MKMRFKILSKTLDNLKFWICKTFGSKTVSVSIEAKKYLLEHWWELKHFDIVRVVVKQYGRKVINLSGTVESVKLDLIENKTFSKNLKYDWDEYK